MSSDIKLSEDLVKGSRLFFTIGYILRIFPYINIVGFLLTIIGWLKLSLKLREKFYTLALIGSILLFVVTIYSTYISIFSALQAITIMPSEEVTFDIYKSILRNTTVLTKMEMENPSVYCAELLIGIAIILEAIGIKQLCRDTRKFIPLYLAILFIALAILHIIIAIMHPVTAPGLDQVLESIDKSESLLDLQNAFIKLMMVILPLTIVAAINFIVTIITYAIFAYKYWKLYGELVRLRIITRGEATLESV